MEFLRGSSRVRYLGLLLLLAGCQGSEDGDQVVPISQQRFSGLVSGNSAGGAAGDGTPTDSLTTYAAKCDAATGIHVPTFSCLDGVEIFQGSSVDNVEVDNAIGLGTGGGRVPPLANQTPPTTAETVTAVGSGTGGAQGIGGTSDKFYFSYANVFGSGKAEVKVTSLPSPSTARAGLMIRQGGTGASEMNALLAITPTGGVIFQHRDTAGATTSTPVTVASSLPIWLRLNWGSSGVTAQYSANHSTWTQIGSLVPLNILSLGTVAVGMAVTSGSATAAATAGFDKFMTTKKCDTPNVLNAQCDLGARFKVLARTADAIAVANCRKEGEIADDMFTDIAVIQYNRQNGAICFYQNDTRIPHTGSSVTSPSLGNVSPNFPWVSPRTVFNAGCTGCHDSGGLIRSPFLWQTGQLPYSQATPPFIYEGYENNGGNPLQYVGADFAPARSWSLNADPKDAPRAACNSCHILAANNTLVSTPDQHGGTGWRFDLMATSQDQRVPGESSLGSVKNDVSPTSPLWMRPPVSTGIPNGQTTVWDATAQAALDSATSFHDCAVAVVANGGGGAGLPSGCSAQPLGIPYLPPVSNLIDLSVGVSGGSSSGSLAAATLNAPQNTDITGTSDKFFWSYANLGNDGTAVVKVTSLANVSGTTNAAAKAGIMVRPVGGPVNAPYVLLAMTKGNGATFQYRPTLGAATPAPAFLTGVSLPLWLRLARSGNTWVGSVSTDSGTSWKQVGGPVTIPALTATSVGLVATTFNPSTSAATATFESFDWTRSDGWTQPNDPHLLTDANIGVMTTGGRTESKTVDTVSSKQGDIAGTADQFSYSFKTFGGDGVAITKVTSQTATPGALNTYAKAGLMFRETAADNSANVFLGKTGYGATIQQRTTAGATTLAPTNVTSPALPVWFRLIRTGNTFIGSMSGDGMNWTQVGDPAVFTTFSFSPLIGLAVSSHSTTDTSTASFDSDQHPEPPGFQWTPGLTQTWLDASMGMPGGSHVTNAGPTEVITASGADIYNYSDQFFFSWKYLTGPGTIMVHVDSLVPVAPAMVANDYAKAGVMFRDSATGGAPNAFMAITATKGASFQYRSVAGGTTPVPPFVPSPVGCWLRIVRSGASGTVFTGSVSQDKVNWTTVGSVTMSTVAQTALVGLAVTSHDASNSVKATFSGWASSP